MRLTSITTPGQYGPGSNNNEEILHKAPKPKPHYQIQHNVTPSVGDTANIF